MMNYQKMIVFVAVFIAWIGGLSMWVEHRFEHKKYTLHLPQSIGLWQHRGDHRVARANSVKSFELALSAGAKGVEIDIHYSSDLNRFVVSYPSYPYEQFDGRLVFLEEVLSTFGRQTYYWLDFKNLTFKNSQAALQRMQWLLSQYSALDLAYVESTRGYLLRSYTKNGINTL